MSGKQEIIKSMIGGWHDILIIGRQKTNADRIRSMTDEELARFIARQTGRYCDFKDPEEEEYPKVLSWLKAPVEVQK